MVSQRKILGEPPVVFITVGTTKFNFVRLFRTIDNLLLRKKKEMLVIVQMGGSKYTWKYKNVISYKEMDPKLLVQTLKVSNKIITHGGFGTLHTISKNCQIIPLIISRQKKFGEHVDDHQKYFLNFIKRQSSKTLRKYLVTASVLNKILEWYLFIDKGKKLSNSFFKPNKFLNHKIEKYLDTL